MEFRDRIQGTFSISFLTTINVSMFFGCTLDNNWATDELYSIKTGKYVFNYDLLSS